MIIDRPTYMNKFLDSPEAQEAKNEVETNQIKKIGNLEDFDNWIDQIAAEY